MPSVMRKLPETITLTCSQYAIEVDPADRERFSADPDYVVRRLIDEAGAPKPNAILMDEAAKDAMLNAGDGGAPLTVHIDSPPSHASRYIIFVL